MATDDSNTKLCIVEGCGNKKSYRTGHCAMHYMRLKTHGVLDKIERRKPNVCKVEGCEQSSGNQDYCRMHTKRIKRTGAAGKASPMFTRVKNEGNTCKLEGCGKPARLHGFCSMHGQRNLLHGSPGSIYPTRSRIGFGAISNGYHIMYKADGKQRGVHRKVAEDALGKPLPDGAIVHHIDENKLNNAKDNLVICPDRAYHVLIHTRMDAISACGHADWRKCKFCKQYDSIENLYTQDKPMGSIYHRSCEREYSRSRRAMKSAQAQV